MRPRYASRSRRFIASTRAECFNTVQDMAFSTSSRCEQLHTRRHVRLVRGSRRVNDIPSSSSKICSSPTFWPRECLALAPHTIALETSMRIKRETQHTWEKENLLLQLFGDLLVNGVAKVPDGAFATFEHDGCRVVRGQAAWLCVDSHEVEGLPHCFDKFVDIEPVLG